jgi:enamine deaminase RidA (YjgF/YER057c/UK114 family)
MGDRLRITSGGAYEARIGYSRAIVVGNACFVSGTTDAGPDGRSTHPGDARAQATAALEVIDRALREAGFAPADVVRTRMYLTDRAYATAVGDVHRERFGEVRPASAMIIVAGFADPSLLVEIEVDAIRD